MINPTISPPNYKTSYNFISSDCVVVSEQPQVRSVNTPIYKLSDSNRNHSRQANILIKINGLTTGLTWNFSNVAVLNAIALYTKAHQAKLEPKLIEHLENDEGVFMDFTRDDEYYAFELYNDGEIITIKKLGDQNSIIEEFETIDQIVL